MPGNLWGEATIYAVYIRNSTPRALDGHTRDTRFREVPAPTKPPKIITFGCAAYAHLEKRHIEHKFTGKAERCVFLGVDTRRQCYRLCTLPHFSIIYSAHIVVNEDEFPCSELASNTQQEGYSDFVETVFTTGNESTAAVSARPVRARGPSRLSLEAIANRRHADPPEREGNLAHYNYDLCFLVHDITASTMAAQAVAALPDPTSRAEATDSRRADMPLWLASDQSEVDSHVENKTFGPPVPANEMPPGVVALKLKTIRNTKRSAKKKSRVVAPGYRQVSGIDYNDTFAPTPQIDAILLVVAVATHFSLQLDQADATTAFLQPDVDCVIWCILPPMFFDLIPSLQAARAKHGKVYNKMLKGVPGIKQGSRLWYKNKVNPVMLAAGFTQSKAEPALYIIRTQKIFVIVWTDDLLMASPPNNAHADKIKATLMKELKLSSWGPVDDMLGCVIKSNTATRITTLSQEASIESIFKRSGLSAGNPIATPMQSDMPITKADCRDDAIAPGQSPSFKCVSNPPRAILTIPLPLGKLHLHHALDASGHCFRRV